MAAFSKVKAFFRLYPISRGMVAYAAIWPTSSLIQQTIQGKNFSNYNYAQMIRFSLYGSLFTAPTLYCWIRLSTQMWPKSNVKNAIKKALLEQVTYGPFAMSCFFFGMTLMEGNTMGAAAEQVRCKFVPTYKVAVCVWPILQTINFAFIKERNRVPFVSICSCIWTCFLAYMHELNAKDLYTEQETT